MTCKVKLVAILESKFIYLLNQIFALINITVPGISFHMDWPRQIHKEVFRLYNKFIFLSLCVLLIFIVNIVRTNSSLEKWRMRNLKVWSH